MVIVGVRTIQFGASAQRQQVHLSLSWNLASFESDWFRTESVSFGRIRLVCNESQITHLR